MKSPDRTRRVGLARALSKLGHCSRSQAAALIRAGRVRLNGTVKRDPESPVHLEKDHISVDGEAIRKEKNIYLMMNKPRGIITTASDEEGRDTIYSLLARQFATNPSGPLRNSTSFWIAPVGRLDKASEGLLLLTNDSEWAARITDPETHLDKTYHVQIGVLADDALLDNLKRGIKVEGSECLRVKQVRRLRSGQKNCWLEIILDEGKNRQIRRMFEALGIEVLRLIRVAIGQLQLGDLEKGAVRDLTQAERDSLTP